MRPHVIALALVLLIGLANTAAAEEVPVVRFTVEQFTVEGESPIDAGEAAAVLAPFLGAHEGLDGLLDATKVLEDYILEQGHSFHRVVLPQQTLEAGVVRLEVIIWTVGEITVKGNEHFSEENILRTLPSLEQGAVPNTERLAGERYLANQHASKQIELRLRESEEAGKVDAEIAVEDSKPLNYFLAFNNTGNDATGQFRATAGFQHS